MINSLNFSDKRHPTLWKCVTDCIRKQLPVAADLSDGILFIRAYNARRRKGTEAIIVELPGPREDRLTPQKARYELTNKIAYQCEIMCFILGGMLNALPSQGEIMDSI